MTQREYGFDTLSERDRLLIEGEHSRMGLFLKELRDTCCEYETTNTCQECGQEKAACCQGRLASFSYDFLDMVEQHFENEESILRGLMSSSEDEPYFLLHKQAHEMLMLELRGVMQESLMMNKQGRTAEAFRLLYQRTLAMFGEHASSFDSILSRV
jgi:hypothetical protein